MTNASRLMRFAVVVVPSHKARGKGRAPSPIADRVSDRLSEPDAGYEVVVLEARRRLGERLSRTLSAQELAHSPVFVLISARVVLDGEGEAFVRIAKDERLGFAEIRSLLSSATDQAFIVADVWHRPDEDDPTLSATVVGAIRDAIDPSESGIGLMVGASAVEGTPEGPSEFLRLWLDTLERGPELVRKSGEAIARALYDQMKRQSERFHKIAGCGFFVGRGDFPLLSEPSIVVGAPSRRSGRPSGGPPSLPPGVATPDVDEAWRAGSAAFHDGRHQEAIEHYKRALLLLGQKPERAELYYRIGRAKEELGSATEAIHNYDKALGIEPLHREAVDHAAKLLRGEKDYARLEKLFRRRFEAVSEPAARVRELSKIADVWFDEAKDMQKATGALERLLALEESKEAYEKLVRARLDLSKPAGANEARKRWARLETEGVARGSILAAAARTAAEHLPNGGDAVELARQALEADPGALEALEVAANLLGTRRRWRELADLYEWLIERARDEQVIWDLAKKLGMLAKGELGDRPAAIRAFCRAAEANPADFHLRFLLADLYEADGDFASATKEMCAAAHFAPSEPDVYRRALAGFEKLKEADRAWCAASVLDELGEADINESLLADTHRPEGLITPQASFDAEILTLLRPERDEKLERVLAIIAPAAIEIATERLQLPELSEASLQSPSSTTMLARSSTWASRLLDVEPPRLHVLGDVPGSMVALPIAERTVVAAKSLGSGLGLPELAFLWTRVLVLLLPEHRVWLAYPKRIDLGKLLLGALSVAEVEGAEAEGEAARLAEELGERLEADALDELRTAAKELGRRRIRSRVETFARSVVAAASRAGLVASGDVALATDLVRRFPLPGEVSVDEQLADVRAFAISSEHHEIRERLQVSVNG